VVVAVGVAFLGAERGAQAGRCRARGPRRARLGASGLGTRDWSGARAGRVAGAWLGRGEREQGEKRGGGRDRVGRRLGISLAARTT
jgi:hypothetical protein